MSDEDLIRRGDAIELARKQCLLSVDDLRALPAVQVAVKPDCGHPWCGDKCGTEVSTAQPSPDVAELVALLAEARADLAAYVDADWPEHQRSNYPPIQAKWTRDMELCWQIDAALARVKGGAKS